MRRPSPHSVTPIRTTEDARRTPRYPRQFSVRTRPYTDLPLFSPPALELADVPALLGEGLFFARKVSEEVRAGSCTVPLPTPQFKRTPESSWLDSSRMKLWRSRKSDGISGWFR